MTYDTDTGRQGDSDNSSVIQSFSVVVVDGQKLKKPRKWKNKEEERQILYYHLGNRVKIVPKAGCFVYIQNTK